MIPQNNSYFDRKKKILATSGNVRKNSSNESILNHIAYLFKDELELSLYNEFDKLPHFNPETEDDDVTQSVKDFRQKIANADGVIICTPEYVFSLPGSLKNALEWTVSTTVFSNKPFVFIVASGLGQKAFESLDLVMSTILQYQIPANAKLLIQGARAKLDDHGQIFDVKLLAEITTLVESLILQIQRKGTLG